MTVVIRPYVTSDIVAVSEIYRQSRPYEFTGELPHDFSFHALTREPDVMAMFVQSIVFVLEEDRVVKGFIGYVHDYIAWLYVHPDFHGQRVGCRLLMYVLAQLKDKPVRLSLVQSNQVARDFYESFGFSEVGTFGFEFQGKQLQGIRMERPIQ